MLVTNSLMKCWFSSLERKTLEPSVSLLMSAISWTQSPNCKASTLVEGRSGTETRLSTASDTYLMFVKPTSLWMSTVTSLKWDRHHSWTEQVSPTSLRGHRCSLYCPLRHSWCRLTCCPKRLCCRSWCPERSYERSCCSCLSPPSLRLPVLDNVWSLLWKREKNSSFYRTSPTYGTHIQSLMWVKTKPFDLRAGRL